MAPAKSIKKGKKRKKKKTSDQNFPTGPSTSKNECVTQGKGMAKPTNGKATT